MSDNTCIISNCEREKLRVGSWCEECFEAIKRQCEQLERREKIEELARLYTLEQIADALKVLEHGGDDE